MSIVHVRGIDEKTYRSLQEEADKSGISFSELVRRILRNHAMASEVENIDQKYRAFVSDLMGLYQMDRDEMRDMVEKAEKLSLLLIEKLERWDD